MAEERRVAQTYQFSVSLPIGEGPDPTALETKGDFCRIPVGRENYWGFIDAEDALVFVKTHGGTLGEWSKLHQIMLQGGFLDLHDRQRRGPRT